MPALPQLIRRFESAPLPELLEAVKRPTAAEAEAFVQWLGRERYEALRRRSLANAGEARRTRAVRGPKPNVVVLHGIMGAELTVRKGRDEDLVWVNLFRLGFGQISRLKMKADGTPETDSFASGMMRKYYLELLLGLAEDANVQAFWFDWRRDLKDSADRLQTSIHSWFGSTAPVMLVGHSMGGLVARTWIKHYGSRWDKDCRLVMLGTPNHGSFAIPQVITGAHKTVRKLATVDLRHGLESFTGILNTFPGSLYMLPSPLVLPEMTKLYDAATWSGRGVSQALLDRARKHHDSLAGITDAGRMIYVAGYGHLTAHGVRNWNALDSLDGYTLTNDGDETVPHVLGFLNKVPVRYSPATHGDLPNDPDVVSAVRQYLTGEAMSALATAAPAVRGRTRGPAAAKSLSAAWDAEVAEFSALVQVQRSRGTRAPVLDLEAHLLRGFLGVGGPGPVVLESVPVPAKRPRGAMAVSVRSAGPSRKKLRIRLVFDSIVHAGRHHARGVPPVDFLSAGHYTGYEPTAGELALDLLLSRRHGLIDKDMTDEHANADRLYITQATRRGALSMQLGEPCLFPVPRASHCIALMGLGHPGEFGSAELSVALQEFIPAIARLGCRHLATVLVGAGRDNLDIPTAADAWLQSLAAISDAGLPRPECLTFVEYSAVRCLQIDAAFRRLAEELKSLDYSGPAQPVKLLTREAAAELRRDAKRKLASLRKPEAAANRISPTFINISRTAAGFEFSAITNSASIPQRLIKVDPALIADISTRLSECGEAERREEWGRALEKVLIPRELRARLFSSAAPVVLALDAATARIPWEMLRLPRNAAAGSDAAAFLSTAAGYGVTRQFRTTFAPAPELNRSAHRDLKFLIVADPAEDAPLEGAQEEGMEAERIVCEFRKHYEAATGCTVKLETLLGPSHATRADVVRLLTTERFDALHFAGHCYYDAADPEQSGWIFHQERNERITAAELSRLDCVPPFIFSNACESGVTPDRAAVGGLALAPAFAEAFFQRGVRNFICTAWPVDDSAALTFARKFYESFLGLDGQQGASIREAVRLARCAAFVSGDSANTWGAYQHYGNPEFRLAGSESS